MNILKALMMGATGMLLTVTYLHAQPAPPQGTTKTVQPVEVTNTPLPVSGAVSVTATTNLPVRNVDNPALTPYWGYASGTFGLNYINMQLTADPIPSGQRLVIEHVAIVCTMDADDNVALATVNAAKLTGGGAAASYSVPIVVQKQGNTWDGKVNWVASQPVRLYSDSTSLGTSVNVYHSKMSAQPLCSAFVSGHTIMTQ